MRKLFTFTRAQRRRTTQRWLLGSFVLGAAAVLIPGLAISTFGHPASSAPTAPTEVQAGMALTRTPTPVACSDFDNQWEAQAFLQTQKVADRHRLDDDRDGVACEQLP